jgi:hypothetical protein
MNLFALVKSSPSIFAGGRNHHLLPVFASVQPQPYSHRSTVAEHRKPLPQ